MSDTHHFKIRIGGYSSELVLRKAMRAQRLAIERMRDAISETEVVGNIAGRHDALPQTINCRCLDSSVIVDPIQCSQCGFPAVGYTHEGLPLCETCGTKHQMECDNGK